MLMIGNASFPGDSLVDLDVLQEEDFILSRDLDLDLDVLLLFWETLCWCELQPQRVPRSHLILDSLTGNGGRQPGRQTGHKGGPAPLNPSLPVLPTPCPHPGPMLGDGSRDLSRRLDGGPLLLQVADSHVCCPGAPAATAGWFRIGTWETNTDWVGRFVSTTWKYFPFWSTNALGFHNKGFMSWT